MRVLEIIMRCICFILGICLAFGVKIEMKEAGAAEVFANTLLVIIWLGTTLCLLVLPWVVKLRN